ncbi:MAG: hypothetical protein GPOALKHO_001886 [Sodalis sp.]|nr:MAG: hypothetical protein GPOALKHO_001886 [Sodalis sp.]
MPGCGGECGVPRAGNAGWNAVMPDDGNWQVLNAGPKRCRMKCLPTVVKQRALDGDYRATSAEADNVSLPYHTTRV